MHECLPLVVLADKKDRKIPHGSEIKRFVKNAFACGAVTEEEATKLTSVTHDEFVSASFVKILKNRQTL